jgi:hypothetical protein
LARRKLAAAAAQRRSALFAGRHYGSQANDYRKRRCDESTLGVGGLFDLETGVRFLIEDEKLFVEYAPVV